MAEFVLLVSPFRVTDSEAERYADRYTRAELVRQNLAYARLALRDARSRGEVAIAPFLLYSQILTGADDDRADLLKLSNEWAHRVDTCVTYLDLGESDEIRLAHGNARLNDISQSRRMLFDGRSDVREILERTDLSSFPYLEDCRAAEYLERASGTRKTYGK
jgi:hypothetical protein